jgi:serine/threonine-protein kinase
MEEKRYADSAAMTQKALQIDNKDFRVWSNLVLAYEWLNDKAKAASARAQEIIRLKDAAKLRPQDATLQSALASSYAGQGDRGKALSHMQTALALAPHNSQVLADVASVYESLGDRKSALHYIEDAVKYGYPLSDVQASPDLQPLVKDPNFRPNGK